MNTTELQSGIAGIADAPTRQEFYTNYPPFKYWNSESNDDFLQRPHVNIYVHIPFCSQTCAFCYYKKDLIKSYSEVEEYIHYLKKEIALTSRHFDLKGRPVGSIYFGGGTPSLLKEKEFMELVEVLREHHSIDRPEFSVEVDPGSASKTKLDCYVNAGVNRISMGVQSFDDRIIKLSHRNHTAEKAIRAAEMIKAKDPNICINVDLLSGLAGDSLETFSRSVDVALGLGIEMITIYKMITYANTFFFDKSVRKDEIPLPSTEEEIVFFNAALDKIEEANYHFFTAYAFTKSNYHHSYIENTFRGGDLIAYGTSAFGKLNGIQYQNSNNMETYKEKINSGKLPVYRTHRLTMKDQMIRELLLTTKLTSYSKREFIKKYGFDYYDLIPGTIAALEEKGYIEIRDNDHVLTRKGIVYGDYVGQVLASSLKQKIGADSMSFIY